MRTRKCTICKRDEALFAWQPDLGAVRDNFYTLGYHQRGFMAIPTCDHCRQSIKSGKNVQFRYRGLTWWTQGNSLVNSSMSPYQ